MKTSGEERAVQGSWIQNFLREHKSFNSPRDDMANNLSLEVGKMRVEEEAKIVKG